MSKDLLGKLDNLTWEASEWAETSHNESATELDSDALLLSITSHTTSPSILSLRKPQRHQSSLRQLPSRKALKSGLESLHTMLECLEALAEQESEEIQRCLDETVSMLKNSPSWGTTVFHEADLYPHSLRS